MSLAPGTKKYEYAVRETTQWEDILVKHNILLPDEELEAKKAALERARQKGEKADPTAAQKIQRAAKDEDRLKELEDELANDDDDERLLERFRAARLEEMKRQAREAKFGTVERLSRDEFIAEVTEASKNGGPEGRPMHVVVELFKDGIEFSVLVSRAVKEIAQKHPTVKFVRMIADQCIENWPDSRVPSLFVYYNGALKNQLIGFDDCGSGRSRILAEILVRLGVLPRTDEREEDEDEEERAHTVRASKGRLQEDWE